MIFNKPPSSWKDLEHKTREILKECGYTIKKGKIKTARDSVSVDVFAKNSNEVIICECKFWNKSVSKNIVHSFITIVSNFGANKGYIISLNGFQKGAYDAAKNTNIILVNWFEFQQKYESRWIENKARILYNESDLLFRFTDNPVPNNFLENLTKQEEELYWKMYSHYKHLWLMAGALYNPFMLNRHRDPVEEIKNEFIFPMKIGIPMGNKKIILNDFYELFEYIDKYQKEGIKKFLNLTKLNIKRQR